MKIWEALKATFVRLFPAIDRAKRIALLKETNTPENDRYTKELLFHATHEWHDDLQALSKLLDCSLTDATRRAVYIAHIVVHFYVEDNQKFLRIFGSKEFAQGVKLFIHNTQSGDCYTFPDPFMRVKQFSKEETNPQVRGKAVITNEEDEWFSMLDDLSAVLDLSREQSLVGVIPIALDLVRVLVNKDEELWIHNMQGEPVKQFKVFGIVKDENDR